MKHVCHATFHVPFVWEISYRKDTEPLDVTEQVIKSVSQIKLVNKYHIIRDSGTIELTVHTSCYCVLDLLCVLALNQLIHFPNPWSQENH